MSPIPSKVVIFGTGSLAEMVSFYFAADSAYNVVAFTATGDRIQARLFSDRPVVPYETIMESHPPSDYAMFIAVGYQEMNHVRSHFYFDAKAKGYQLPSCVTSQATGRGTLHIGDNCCVFDSSTIEPFARIGNDVVVWNGAHVGHHSSIGDHSFLAPHAVIAGNTDVGEHCFFGVNSTVRDGLTIANDCLIAAGALVMRDTAPGEVFLREGASSASSVEFFRPSPRGQ